MDSVKAPPSVARFARTVLPRLYRQANARRMVELVKRVVRTDRWNSFDRFHDTTRTLQRAYHAAGAQTEVYTVPTGGPTGSGRWIIPEAADIHAATVDILSPIRRRLLDYRRNPWHVVQWTAATPPGGLACKLLVVDTEEELARIKPGGLTGTMALTRLNLRDNRRAFCDKGTVGIISDAPVAGFPDAVAWTKFGWGGLSVADSSARLAGLAISGREGDKLRSLIAKHGPLTIRVTVDVRPHVGSHDVVSGIVRGRDDPQDEVWAVAHSCEPGALDNASGLAVCVEIARILRALPPPRRSIRLVHAYECYGFFHYLEHQKRFQPPLAGVCIDTVGAKPSLCNGELRWHATVPASAQFVNAVGATMVTAALRLGTPGYRFVPRPFASTEDTLLGDPQYGFPCPWLTNHPYRGYHSSADTPTLLHPRGLRACAAAMAGYLYYLADATTGEALELARHETDRLLVRLRECRGKRAHANAALLRAQHALSTTRLKRWLWGGDRRPTLADFAACERRVANSAPTPSAPHRSSLNYVVRRSAPLAPTAENTWPHIAPRTQRLPKWTAYWADGVRSIGAIAQLLSAELQRDVTPRQVLEQFQALSELQYVDLTPTGALVTKSRLVRDLRRLGLQAGMNVMVHSALSKLGHVADGPGAVIDALLTVIGKRGTLLMPSFNHFNAHVFNPLATPTTNGAIPDAMWRRPDAVRSLHPSHAVCAIGPRAEEWCAGHLHNSIWAANSPIGHLIESGGYILSLGVDHNATTAYHLAEIALGVPCLDQFGSRDRIVTPDGHVQQVAGLAWRAGNCPKHPREIGKLLDRRSLQRHGNVGNAAATLVKARDVWNMRRLQVIDLCPTCAIRPERRPASPGGVR
jgi:aminoglycoside 3-N-acetyltransferase